MRSDNPVAPPPAAFAGRMQQIQPNEYKVIPTVISRYSFKLVSRLVLLIANPIKKY